ncbi:MAG: permease [Clostridia bacterium]|nr:permease [Clostridia bacterium]
MIDVLRREAIYLWYFFSIQFDQIVGYWAIGIVIGSLISVFGKNQIHQSFQALQSKKLGVLGVIPACAIGIASPLCMYGTIPIAASFSQRGIKDDWLAAFMMGSILLNPQLIIYSAALGPVALAIRIAACFICGIAAGLCVHFFYTKKGKGYFRFAGFSEPANRDIDPRLLFRLLKNIWRNVKITAPYFLIGILLSAMFQRYMPDDVMVRVFGGNRAFGILMSASIGVPLYVCGGGTVPLLQYWMAGGMSLGSAAAFMVSGPATKITNLGALKIVLGMKRFVVYILFCMVFAFLAGLLIDMI